MSYDGTTTVTTEIARLYGFSPKSQAKTAKLMKEARVALNIGNNKHLTPKQNTAIFEYHQSKAKPVEHVSQTVIESVENIQQPTNEAVEYISQHYDPYKLARVAFYTNIGGIKKRQVVALHGFMLNALMVAIKSSRKPDIPKWLNNQPFIAGLPITLQVQQAIVKALL